MIVNGRPFDDASRTSARSRRCSGRDRVRSGEADSIGHRARRIVVSSAASRPRGAIVAGLRAWRSRFPREAAAQAPAQRQPGLGYSYLREAGVGRSDVRDGLAPSLREPAAFGSQLGRARSAEVTGRRLIVTQQLLSYLGGVRHQPRPRLDRAVRAGAGGRRTFLRTRLLADRPGRFSPAAASTCGSPTGSPFARRRTIAGCGSGADASRPAATIDEWRSGSAWRSGWDGEGSEGSGVLRCSGPEVRQRSARTWPAPSATLSTSDARTPEPQNLSTC